MSISSDAIRGYIDLIVLGLLAEQDMYGYEISKEVLRRTEQLYALNEASMYSGFRRLEKQAYIESYYSEEASKGSKRRYYHITEKGKVYYRFKCQEWQYTKKIVDRFVREELWNE